MRITPSQSNQTPLAAVVPVTVERVKPDISHFDSLPNAALIAINEMAAVMGKGVSSAWRDIKSDPDFPQPIRLSAGCTRFNVGDIRGYLTKKVSMSAKPMRNQRLKGQVAA